MKYNIIYILIFLSSCLSFNGFTQEKIQFTQKEKQWIADHPVIEFGYDHRWEPYEIYSGGQYGGIISDYIEIIEEKSGLDFQAIPDLDWTQSLKGLTDGNIMIVPNLVFTPERDKQFKLSKPYIQDPIVIVASKDSPYFSTLADLRGQTIALGENYYTVELIKNNYPEIKIKEYKTIQECLKSIIDGESAAFIGYLNVVTYYINHYGFDNLRIVGTTPFEEKGISFAVNFGDKILIDIIDKVLDQVTPEQKHHIRETWIAGKGREIYSTVYIIWAFCILLLGLIGLAVFYYWNRVLKKQLEKRKETEQQLNSLLIEVKRSDEEKKVLLQEIHHRVKNNLQIVTSMLNLQANTTTDEKTRQVLKEAMDRVSSIALVHKKMYQTPNNITLNLKGYIETLFEEISSHHLNFKNVKLKIGTVEVNSKMESFIPLALILNELISNSLNYAFHSQKDPLITIDFNVDDDNKSVEVIYSDNGSWIENEESDEFGTSMIDIFTEQIDGNYRVIKKKDSTTFVFTFEGLNKE